MEATIERRRPMKVPTLPLHWQERRVMACGWCKGFVHEEWVSDMQRYVHDEKPTTDHEVLPYQVR